jgi:amino acid transporter
LSEDHDGRTTAQSTATATTQPGRPDGPALTLGVLRRQITLIPLVGLIYFSVSGGPYGLENAVGSSGPGMAMLLIVVIPLVFAIPCALMNAELGSSIPLEGGYYYWVKAAMGPFAGFVEGMSSWLTSFLDTALYPVLFVDYLATWFPGVARGQHVLCSAFGGNISIDLHWLLAIAFMLPLILLNIRGAKVVGDTSAVLTGVIIAPFVILTALGVWRLLTVSGVDPLHPAVLAGQSKVSAFNAGLAVVIWNYVGFDSISTAGDEIDRPKRTYPLALAISVPLIMMSYLLPLLAALASGLHHRDPSQWTDGDFALVGQLLGGSWLKVLVIVGAGVANVGLFSSLLLSGSRVPAVLAADRYLPKGLAATHRRFGTPVNAILVSCAVFAVFCAMNFVTLLDADIVLGLGGLLLEVAALLVLRKRFPDMVRPFRIPGGWPVVLLVVALPTAVAVGVLWGTYTSEPSALWLGVGGFVLSALLYVPCRWWWKRSHPDAAVDVAAVDFGPGVDAAALLERRRSKDDVAVVVA